MSLIERGQSAAEGTRHIAIKYFWLKERVDQGEARVRHLDKNQGHVRQPTDQAVAGDSIQIGETRDYRMGRRHFSLEFYFYDDLCLMCE